MLKRMMVKDVEGDTASDGEMSKVSSLVTVDAVNEDEDVADEEI